MTNLIPLLFLLTPGQPIQKSSIEEIKTIADQSYSVQYHSPTVCKNSFAALNNDSTCDELRSFLKACNLVPTNYKTGENVEITDVVVCK